MSRVNSMDRLEKLIEAINFLSFCNVGAESTRPVIHELSLMALEQLDNNKKGIA